MSNPDDADGVGEPGPAAGPGRQAFAHYRALLERHGFRPSRRLGQNFLLEPRLHAILADSVQPGDADLVLEVGPGLGFLTRELAARSPVVAVEIDGRLHAVLQEELLQMPGGDRVTLLHGDVLARGRLAPVVLAAIAGQRAALPSSGRFLVVANLPYAIAGPLLGELCQAADPPDASAVLVQRELAERCVAPPGGREYGALSVLVQLCYEAGIVRRVGREVFRPRPRVDSAMLRLVRRAGGLLDRPAATRVEFAAFLRRLFAGRRKKLSNAAGIREGMATGALAQVLDQRPDQVAPAVLAALFEASRESA